MIDATRDSTVENLSAASEAYDAAALGDSELFHSGEESHGGDEDPKPSDPESNRVITKFSTDHPGRVVEVGYIPNFAPQKFALYFEGFPHWLLALERSFCAHLYILGWDSASDLKRHLESTGSSVALVHRAIVHLGLGRVSYQRELDGVDALVLVSGEPAFLQQAAEALLGRPALFLGASHRSSKRPPPGPAWRLLPHRSYGGPTQYVALFGAQGLVCKPVATSLRRSVGHIFDFGMRPDPLEGEDTPLALSGIGVDGILHPADLERPVVHPTSFYKSGWGIRALTPNELGIAFGFPAWLRVGGLTPDLFPCVPLQIMDACLREVLEPSVFTSPLAPKDYVITSLVEGPSEWLPGIGRFLPHSWIPSDVITDKAVKHDDAVVHTAMWDNRITLVHPWSPATSTWLLDFFRRHLMFSHRHRLMTEFREYMRATHGADWAFRLDAWRSRANAGPPQARPGRKRQRGGTGRRKR
jgi:hypothetical protein